MDIDQLFNGLAKAQINGRGTFMSEGLYIVDIQNIFVKEGFKGKSFIAEFTIVESNNDDHKPGVTRSWVLNFSKQQTFPDISKFMMALLGDDPSVKANQENPEIRKAGELYARATCGSPTAKSELGAKYEEGMFKGARLRLECTEIKTKANTPFTVHAWSPL